jgi:hypothetical protein
MSTDELVLPNGYISREWIEAEYNKGREEGLKLNASVTQAEVNARLTTLANMPGGMSLMAKEQRSPLLREQLYESVIRNLFQVYKLSQGETAEFWADVAVGAMAIGVDGLPTQAEVKSSMARVDTRLFASNPYARWNQTNLTKFDLLNAIQQRMKASLMLQEAAAGFRLIRYASGVQSGQTPIVGLEFAASAFQANAPVGQPTSTAGRLSIQQIANAQAGFGARLVPGPLKMWINPLRGADLKTFNLAPGGVAGGLGFFVPNMQEALLNKHNTATFMGMDVYEDVVVPYLDSGVANSTGGTENIMGYLIGPAEYTGILVIRTDLVIETMKDINRYADVFAGWMDLAFYSRWVKGFQRLINS